MNFINGRQNEKLLVALFELRLKVCFQELAKLFFCTFIGIRVNKRVKLSYHILRVLEKHAPAIIRFKIPALRDYFIESLPRTVPVANLYIGLGKGVVFGFVIALVACHFGLRVRPDTESLSTNTTRSVVTAITSVILVDALFAIFTRHVGVPTL